LLQDKIRLQILTLCLLVLATGVQGQNLFSGTMVDATTNEPLPYVNIGILNKGIGTVSNEEGKFVLKIFKEKQGSEAIQFSSIGYTTLSMPIKDLVFDTENFQRVKLKPKIEILNEVILTKKGALKPFPEEVGYPAKNLLNYGYWNKDIALGGELATKILVRKGPRKLRRLSINVLQKQADSVLVRINIYDGSGRLPQENLANDNIIISIKDVGMLNIELTPYAIEVKDDFIVSLELLKVYGTTILPLILVASDSKGQSYKRYASQDKWEVIEDAAMAYVLDTDYYTLPKGKYKKKKARVNRKITGYVFKRGRGVSDIKVLNEVTKKAVSTNEKGSYQIEAETNDILRFYISPKKSYRKKVTQNNTVTINL